MTLKRKRNAIISEINITPFTDVVLVLLVIFMITTPMFMQPGIKVNLPKTQISDREDNSNIEVLILKNGCVYIQGKQIHDSNIADAMHTLVSSHPDKAVIIKGDKEAQYDYIIQFIDKAKKVGVTKFSLAVDKNNIFKN
jgi:biopolymer transport protein ExbD